MSGIDPEDLACRLAADRERLVARFAQAALRLRHRSDPAAAHDVRVALRRLEAMLDLWRTCLPRRRLRRARRAMRALRRSAGPVGEARMVVDLLDGWLPSLAGPDRATGLDLARRARRRLRKLEQRSTAPRTKRLVRRARARFEEVWTARGGPGPSCLDHAHARVALRRARAVAALGEGSTLGTDEALHAARVAVKRWRYAGERLGAVMEPEDAALRQWLQSVQGILGRIADLGVLRGCILRWSGRRRPPGAAGANPLHGNGLFAHLEAERSARVEELRRVLPAGPVMPGSAPAPSSPAGAERPGP